MNLRINTSRARSRQNRLFYFVNYSPVGVFYSVGVTGETTRTHDAKDEGNGTESLFESQECSTLLRADTPDTVGQITERRAARNFFTTRTARSFSHCGQKEGETKSRISRILGFNDDTDQIEIASCKLSLQ